MELEEIFAIFSEEEIVVSALKKPRKVSKSPAIMSVITARQIKQMGFRTLSDVLETVPGFDVSMNKNGTREIGVRGILLLDSSKIKVLIDGHSINEPATGGATWLFDSLVVENAKRIEIIRGPGSALYGQNAFLAVINVITKDTDDIDGLQVTASGGSFDTQNYNVLFGKEFGALKASGFFDFFDTEGFSKKIEEDFVFATDPASLTPGRSQNQKERIDLNLKLSYKNLELNSKYMNRKKEGYVGIDNTLSDDTTWRDTYAFTELIYNIKYSEKFNIKTRAYYDYYYSSAEIETRPEGFVDQFTRLFPDGIKSVTRFKEHTLGIETQFNYKVFERNELTFGFQYEWIHQNSVNLDANIFPPTIGPLSSLTDFSHDFPFTRRSATRQIWSLYLQDEWNITKDVDFTFGVRYDHFTRFDSTTNPRAGLIWRFIEDAHLKLLFATAFRAPNFNELFFANNPIEIGNSNLDPEKINTFEVGLGYNFTEHVRGNVNYFFNRIRDRIQKDSQTPSQDQNLGGARIKGIEAELKADWGNDNYVYANYTFQDAEETRDRNRLAFVPIHKANLGFNIGFWKYANANVNTFISGPRPREDGDTRRDLPSYTLSNLTLIGKNFIDNFEIRGSVFNLFDKSYDDPAQKNTVPTDYPQQGRSFIIELRYRF
ncbi:outer membrane receptor protein [Candidatus Scalindua japonica]|uniref:Outer membrane receptor protein n=2 Tax=Candidatus Scalindua japonica TaxID=1284222 RepID=A0A286U1V8_9BACT|nr:outer membrane receptor protein [Candidatus Scalindua japonica]